MSDEQGRVVIVGGGGSRTLPLGLLKRGKGFVVAEWGETLIVGVYYSPNAPLSGLEQMLGEIEAVIRPHLDPILMAT